MKRTFLVILLLFFYNDPVHASPMSEENLSRNYEIFARVGISTSINDTMDWTPSYTAEVGVFYGNFGVSIHTNRLQGRNGGDSFVKKNFENGRLDFYGINLLYRVERFEFGFDVSYTENHDLMSKKNESMGGEWNYGIVTGYNFTLTEHVGINVKVNYYPRLELGKGRHYDHRFIGTLSLEYRWF